MVQQEEFIGCMIKNDLANRALNISQLDLSQKRLKVLTITLKTYEVQ